MSNVFNCYMLKSPKKIDDNHPYIALIRKNLLFAGGVLKQIVVNHGVFGGLYRSPIFWVQGLGV